MCVPFHEWHHALHSALWSNLRESTRNHLQLAANAWAADRALLAEAAAYIGVADPCSLDHHGDCQTHFGNPCWMVRYKAAAEAKAAK